LVAGYHTEYSAMKFSLFFIAEYANMITASAMMVVLFFGGWDLPGHWDEAGGLLQTLVTGLVMFLKTFFFLFVFIWVRWTLPRFRYDQLMSLGWKVLLPIGLAYVMLVGLGIYGVDTLLSGSSDTIKMGALFLLNLPLMFLVFLVLDRGRLVSGSAARRAPAPAVHPGVEEVA
jgi:NADH-quinone oxidoreductase subunit H